MQFYSNYYTLKCVKGVVHIKYNYFIINMPREFKIIKRKTGLKSNLFYVIQQQQQNLGGVLNLELNTLHLHTLY